MKLRHSYSQGSLVTQIEPVNLFNISTCAFRPWHSSTSTRKEFTTVQNRSFSLCNVSGVLKNAELTHIDSKTAEKVTLLPPLPQENSGNSQAATTDQTQSNTQSDYIQYPMPTASTTSVETLDSLIYYSDSEDSLPAEIAWSSLSFYTDHFYGNFSSNVYEWKPYSCTHRLQSLLLLTLLYALKCH